MLKKTLLPLLFLTLLPVVARAQTLSAVELPYTTSFENGDDVEWNFNSNGDGWYIGSAINNTSGGSQSLYVSNTSGATHAVNSSTVSSSYVYRPVNFQTAGQYVLEFDWLNNGMGNFYGMNFMMSPLFTYLVPSTVDMTASDLVEGDNWISCSGQLGAVTTWQHATFIVNIPTAGVYYLAFWYYSMGDTYGVGAPPPPAIDNINLHTLGCSSPTGLAVDTTAFGYEFHWTPGGDESSWIVRSDGGEWVDALDTFYLFTDLAAGMLHTLEVAAVCSGDDTSIVATLEQRTPCGIITSFPWREGFNGFSWNATIPCWTHLGSGAYRFQSNELEIRSSNTDPSIMVSPLFAGLNQLELTFTTHPEGSSSGSLSVGYITGPDETYVFTPLATYNVGEWMNPEVPVEKNVSFAGAPDSARIAFKYNPNVVNWHWYIDNVDVHLLPVCSRPNNLTLVDADDSSIELAWSDDNSGAAYTVYYRASENDEWEEFTTTDTSAVLTDLESGTSYSVRIIANCSDGSMSSEITGTFMTSCGNINVFPHEESFDGSSALCWQRLDMNSSAVDNWDYNTSPLYNRNYSAGAYISSYNDVEQCNEWLVSPLIELTGDMTSATLAWYSHGEAFGGSQPRIEVKVSTTSATDTSAFSTTVYSEDLDEESFIRHTASLAQFAGQNIYVAFVRRGLDDNGVILEDISIYNAQIPEVSIAGAASPVVGLATTYHAVLDDGSREGLTYSWSSTAATAGIATMTMVDSATVTLLYSATVADTIRVVAANFYGADTAVRIVMPMVVTYSALPYSTGFEATDDVAWTITNDVVNAWYIDSVVSAAGSRSLYISNDNGLNNTYSNTATSYSYAYKAFNFASAGQYRLEFDWRCYGEGSFDNLNVYLVPMGTSIIGGVDAANDWTSLTGDLTYSNNWQNFSSIFNLQASGVYNVVFAWKNDYTDGTNPPAAVDNFALAAITCVAPGAVVVDVVGTNMATFHWTGNAAAYEVVVGDMVPVVVTDTFFTIATLQPSTTYDVVVRAICGAGDTSFSVNGVFTTECTHFGVPFSYDFPSTLDVCWTNVYFSPAPYVSWSEGTTANHLIYSAAGYNTSAANDWLITPVIDIPATDTGCLELVYFVYGYRSNNSVSSSANYELLVSPTGSSSVSSFTDTITIETNLDTHSFMRRHFPMSAYAGQSIRVAFRNNSVYNGRIVLSNVGIRRTREPLFSIQGPNFVWTDDTNHFVAVHEEGDLATMTYSWSSSMVSAGQAVFTDSTTSSVGIVYNVAGVDTITFVAHNAFGSDTSVVLVTIMALNPVSTFPYSTGFESSSSDNQSWISLNGTNAWTMGTATNNGGTRACYISNDNGASNAYSITSTSRSYLSRAFDISDSGSYVISFDWSAKGESNFDFLRAWLVPDSLYHVQADGFPASGISSHSALATASIPGWIALGGKLNLSTGWTTETDTVDIDAPGRYHLVFLWVNDATVGTNPPAAIDNVVVSNGSTIFCGEPVIDSVLATETEIFMNFSGDANNYEVAIVNGTWDSTTAVIPVAVTANTFTFTGLTAETQYSVGVRAVCAENYYSDWAITTVTTAVHPCAVPTGLNATDVTYTGATLTWSEGEEGQSAWQVAINGANFNDTVDVATTTYTVTGLSNGTDYTFSVRAVCSATNMSPWSAPKPFTTLDCQPVTNVHADNVTANSAVVSWTAPQGATNFEIEYGMNGFNQGNGIIVAATGTSHTLTGLSATTVYDVYVRTVCGEGVTSAWSSVVDFTTADGEGIDDVNSAAISLYPNPASSTVTLTGIEGAATVTVVDMNGRETGKWTVVDGTLTIDVTEMAQGAYFVRIVGEQVNAIRKLIVR